MTRYRQNTNGLKPLPAPFRLDAPGSAVDPDDFDLPKRKSYSKSSLPSFDVYDDDLDDDYDFDLPPRNWDRDRGRDRDREYDRERDRDRDGEYNRDRDWDRDKDHDRGWERDKAFSWDDDDDDDWESDDYRDRDWERDRDRDHDRDWDRERDRGNGPPPRSRLPEDEDFLRRRPPSRPSGRSGHRGRRVVSHRPPSRRRPSPSKGLPFTLPFTISPLVRKIALFGSAGIAVFVIVIVMSIRLTAHNAFSVRLDGVHVGYIPYNPDADEATFHNDAVAHLQTHLNVSRARVSEQVTLYPTRAPVADRMTEIEMRIALSFMFTNQVEVIDIYVNNEYIATMRNSWDADHVEYLLQSIYFTEYTLRDETTFAETWERRPRFVNIEDIESHLFTPVEAYGALNRSRTGHVWYTVRPNDNLTTIARAHDGANVNRIIYDNDGVSLDGNLYIGQRLRIYTRRPFMTVITVEERVERVYIDMPIEDRPTPDLPFAVTQIHTPGRDGYKIARTRTTFHNGVVYSTEVLASEVMREPTTQIVLVGTAS